MKTGSTRVFFSLQCCRIKPIYRISIALDVLALSIVFANEMFRELIFPISPSESVESVLNTLSIMVNGSWHVCSSRKLGHNATFPIVSTFFKCKILRIPTNHPSRRPPLSVLSGAKSAVRSSRQVEVGHAMPVGRSSDPLQKGLPG